MMSRAIYKGARFEWAPDECAAPLPRSGTKTHQTAVSRASMLFKTTNTYAPLDTGSEIDSDLHSESYVGGFPSWPQ